MDEMNLHILGCGSASPSLHHNPSAQAVEYRGSLYMVDCGEGAQREMMKQGLSIHCVKHIFLSHLHGDHCLGVVPLISSMALHNKGGVVTIHTTPEGERILRTNLNFFCGPADFDVHFNIIDPSRHQMVLETRGLTVEAFPLYHRVPCTGFIFREKPKPRHLRADMLDFYHVPICCRKDITLGADFVTEDGRVIPNAWLTREPTPSVSYAYCSDTAFDTRVAEAVKGVDLLYHEATYTDEKMALAAPRGHSTARQAAEIARLAEAGKLVIGHYSKSIRMDDALAEALTVFPRTVAANEGMKITVSK